MNIMKSFPALNSPDFTQVDFVKGSNQYSDLSSLSVSLQMLIVRALRGTIVHFGIPT